jgi:hypothetical protein
MHFVHGLYLLGHFALLQDRSWASGGSANEGKGENCVLHLEYRSFADRPNVTKKDVRWWELEVEVDQPIDLQERQK